MRWNERKLQILLALLVAALITLSGVSGVMAKYSTQEGINGQITYTAAIGQIGIWERPVSYTATGGFTIGENREFAQKGKSYPIIPGLDIPKDTIVKVDRDNNDDGIDDALTPAYVYLIVDTNIVSDPYGVSYTLDSCWRPIDSTKHPGVYVYSDNSGNAVALNSSVEIPVLVGEKLFVSQHVTGRVTDTVYMNFSVKMRQIVGEQTPAQIYESAGYSN